MSAKVLGPGEFKRKENQRQNFSEGRPAESSLKSLVLLLIKANSSST